jgi:hypothetical protein
MILLMACSVSAARFTARAASLSYPAALYSAYALAAAAIQPSAIGVSAACSRAVAEPVAARNECRAGRLGGLDFFLAALMRELVR